MDCFSQSNLDQNILKTLEEIGYEKPTPIQSLAIPKILEKSDLIATAQTGTGKTAAFMLPALDLAARGPLPRPSSPKVLVLVPTRELALQVTAETKKFSQNHPKIKTVCIYGGIPYPTQKRSLAGRFEILVATPGRLLDHLEGGRIDLSRIELFILDEADRMLDMGFFGDVERIAASTPESRQTLLFSATIDKKMLPLSKKLLKDPFEVKVEATKENLNDIQQEHYYVDNISHKIALLENLLENREIGQSIIFTGTKVQSEELSDLLEEKGYQAEALHGDMNQRQRTRTINKLRNGLIQFLVATDVAARGIDIPSISHVINFDLPFQSEDFVHRVGRTGRAGAKGTAITFSTYKEEEKLKRIKEHLLLPFESCTVPGLEPKPKDQKRSSPKSRDGFKRNFSGGGRPFRKSAEGQERGERQGDYRAPRQREDRASRQGEYRSPRQSDDRPSRQGEYRAPREREDRPSRQGEYRAPREREDRPSRQGEYRAPREREDRPSRQGEYRSPRQREDRSFSGQKESGRSFPPKAVGTRKDARSFPRPKFSAKAAS